jgi:hypothetical protein
VGEGTGGDRQVTGAMGAGATRALGQQWLVEDESEGEKGASRQKKRLNGA